MSYRRKDAWSVAAMVHAHLSLKLGQGSIKIDMLDGIAAGEDYVSRLEDLIARCDVLIAVIGTNWLSTLDTVEHVAPMRTGDWVRVEISTALAAGKRVIPIYVEGANVLRSEDLPIDLKRLVTRQFRRIGSERLASDLSELVTQTKAALESAAIERALAAEAAHQENLRAEEEARRAEARLNVDFRLSRLTDEQILHRREIVDWDAIRHAGSPSQLRAHIANYPAGVTTDHALAQLQQKRFNAAQASRDVADIVAWLDEFRGAPQTDAAQALLNELLKEQNARELEKARAAQLAAARERAKPFEDLMAWRKALENAEEEGIEGYLKMWPDGTYATEARNLIDTSDSIGLPIVYWTLFGALGLLGTHAILEQVKVEGHYSWTRTLLEMALTTAGALSFASLSYHLSPGLLSKACGVLTVVFASLPIGLLMVKLRPGPHCMVVVIDPFRQRRCR